MRRRDELAGAATAAAGGIAALLALCLLLPRATLIPAIAQLMPLMALVLLVLALLLALLRRGWRAAGVAVLAVSVLGLTWSRFESVAAPTRATAAQGVPFKLVSFNALHDNPGGVAAIPYLLDSGADAILLLEAFQFAAELPRLLQAYPYRVGCAGPEPCDTLLLSRHKPLATAFSSMGAVPTRRYAQFTLDVDGARVTLVGAHMSKPYFDEIPDIELDTLIQRLDRIEGPVILAGDFNATPWSPALMKLANATGLRFSGVYVPTWPASAEGFGLPIDHVLTRGADILSLEAMPSAFGSNHRGLVSRIDIPRS